MTDPILNLFCCIGKIGDRPKLIGAFLPDHCPIPCYEIDNHFGSQATQIAVGHNCQSQH